MCNSCGDLSHVLADLRLLRSRRRWVLVMARCDANSPGRVTSAGSVVMTDHSTDEIRDLLARAMSDAPEPHPWTNVVRRARHHDAARPQQRRTRVWLAVAACTIALGRTRRCRQLRRSNRRRASMPPTASPRRHRQSCSTSCSVPTVPGAEAGWTGGLLDDIDGGSLRPLESLANARYLVPTAPRGWRVFQFPVQVRRYRTSKLEQRPNAIAIVERSVEIIEAPPD